MVSLLSTLSLQAGRPVPPSHHEVPCSRSVLRTVAVSRFRPPMLRPGRAPQAGAEEPAADLRKRGGGRAAGCLAAAPGQLAGARGAAARAGRHQPALRPGTVRALPAATHSRADRCTCGPLQEPIHAGTVRRGGRPGAFQCSAGIHGFRGCWRPVEGERLVQVLAVTTRGGAGRSGSTSGTWRPCWLRRAWTCALCRRTSAAMPGGWRRACRWRAATCWCWSAATARCSTRCRRAAPALTQGGLLSETLSQDGKIRQHKGPGVGYAGGEVCCKLPGWGDCPGPRRESCLACPMQESCLACLSEGWGGFQEQAGAAVWHQRDARLRTTSAGSSLQNPTSRGPACACETLADFMWCCCSWVGLTPRPGRPRASCTGRTGRRPRGCRYARSPAAAATRSPPTAACGPLRRPRTPSARSVRRRRARPPAHARRCSLAAPATFMVHAVVIQSKCLYQYVCLYVLWVPGMLAVPVLCSQTRRMLGGSRERCA